jgi:RNA polymerase sigma-70 factor, ECF subfamily
MYTFATQTEVLCQSMKNSFLRGLVVDFTSASNPNVTMETETTNPKVEHSEALSLAQLRSLPDEQLIASLRAGQGDALAILFDRYQKLVLSIALKIVRDPGEAEDVTQTVFLDIYRAVAQFDPRKGTTKIWLMQYAYHRAINRRQHLQGREFYNSKELEEREIPLAETHATFGLSSSETKALIGQALAALSVAQKSVIQLACYEGLSMQEIADRTGESFVNVRHHYYRGLQKLRSFISGGRDKESAAPGGKRG